MSMIKTIFKDTIICFVKDFSAYFRTGIIYILVPLYALLSVVITLYATDFYANTMVNMQQFFMYQPALMSLFVPALTMRFWTDEYKNNTLELLLSQPIFFLSVVLGKFFAAWFAILLMLISSTPLWGIVAYLTELDNSWIFVNYLVTFFMSGSLCAIAALASSFTFNGLGAFLISVAVCMLFTNISFSSLLARLLPENIAVINLMKTFDFRALYNEMIMGQVSLPAFVYFILMIIFCLALNVETVEYKRR